MLEKDWEIRVLSDLYELGWKIADGTAIAPFTDPSERHPAQESILPFTVPEHARESYHSILIPGALKEAISDLNPWLPSEKVQEVFTKVTTAQSHDLISENMRAYRYMTEGVKIEMTAADGSQQTHTARIISRDADDNEWLAVQQVIIKEREREYRFDVVLYCNGLPVGIIELKNPGASNSTIEDAYQQLNTYSTYFPQAFTFNILNIMSDGITSMYGTPFTPYQYLAPWNYTPGGTETPILEEVDGQTYTTLDRMLDSIGNPDILLDMLFKYTLFVQNEGKAGQSHLAKIIAKSHQYFAVEKALTNTINVPTGRGEKGRVGVVWHTQGSGKSYTMLFYARAIMAHKRMHNPTIVVVTDRTDLDDQLYSTFRKDQLLTDHPQRIQSRDELRLELKGRQAGGIYFTTLQKFGLTESDKQEHQEFPLLSDRENIVLIVDEAHRSHYGSLDDGYANNINRALPHAKYIAFTGTPIDNTTGSTVHVFGDYIHVYSIDRAVAEGATVPLYYDSRYIPLALRDGESEETITALAEQITEDLDEEQRLDIAKNVARLKELLISKDRLKQVAQDIVSHWETRRENMEEELGVYGKGMIVTSCREHASKLYDAIVEIRPGWAPERNGEDVHTGKIQVMYSRGPASEGPEMARFARIKKQSRELQARIRDPKDPLELVIVSDMLLTGFDAPAMHTLYMDKSQSGHNLMQTIARINRRFQGKSAGLIVSYLPLQKNLSEALERYADDERIPVENAADESLRIKSFQLLDILDQLRNLLGQRNWIEQVHQNVTGPQRLNVVLGICNSILEFRRNEQSNPDMPDDQRRYARIMARLVTMERTYRHIKQATENEYVKRVLERTDEIEFLRAVLHSIKAVLGEERIKGRTQTPENAMHELRLLAESMLESRDTILVMLADGNEHINIRELNEENLKRIAKTSTPTLAVEIAERAMRQRIQDVAGKNRTRQEYFGDKLKQVVERYNRGVTTLAETMTALAHFEKELRADIARGKALGFTEAETALFDALKASASPEEILDDDVLGKITRDISAVIQKLPKRWLESGQERAAFRVKLKRIFNKYKYPPKAQEKARIRIMREAEDLAQDALLGG